MSVLAVFMVLAGCGGGSDPEEVCRGELSYERAEWCTEQLDPAPTGWVEIDAEFWRGEDPPSPFELCPDSGYWL